MSTGMIDGGRLADTLECRLAERYGFADAVLTGSGCQAIHLVLRALNVGAGSRVALPTYLCPEVLGVVESLEAVPVLADVDDRYGLDWADPSLGMEPLSAVIAPSLLGFEANMGSSAAPVIHDWAHYAPARGETAADVHIAVISFGATKVLCAGGGGAVLVRDPAFAAAVRSLKRIAGTALGLNLYPFSDMQAALALSQLDRLDEMIVRRQRLAERFMQLVAELGDIDVPAISARDMPFRLPMRLSRARLNRLDGSLNSILRRLSQEGVSARRPVAVMLHHLRDAGRDFPMADRLFATTLSLPFYPALTESDIQHIMGAVREVLH